MLTRLNSRPLTTLPRSQLSSSLGNTLKYSSDAVYTHGLTTFLLGLFHTTSIFLLDFFWYPSTNGWPQVLPFQSNQLLDVR